MSRPFISASVDQLEDRLEKALAAGDRKTVDAIAHELTHRRVPRARDLAERIASGQRQAAAPRPQDGARQPFREKSPANPNPVAKRTLQRPTAEQQCAIEAFAKGGSLRINAYAGTGKTSTLQMLAHSTTRRGQYIAFNRAIVADAKTKFPDTVDCATTHGLAFKSTPPSFKQNMDKMTGRMSAQKLAEVLDLRKSWRIDRDHTLQPRSQAFLILETIKRFAQSGDESISALHVPRHGSLLSASEESLAQVNAFAIRGAEHVWTRMCDPEDQLPLGHNGYLKRWALSRPQLACEYILLDEAQDTNPVVLDVLRRQSAQLVYVGDRYQQIYEWRGAVNAMEAIETDSSVQLTQSFRFGPEIAAVASRLLSELGESVPLRGNPALHSRVGRCKPDAILARTNATVITTLVEALNDGRAPHLVGGNAELMELLRGVQDLKANTPSNVPEFFGFENWEQVVEFAGTAEGEHLATFVNLVQARGERQLMWALGRAVDEDRADLVLSTAHKAKGREWNSVRLMDDFLKSRPAKADTAEAREKQAQEEAAELRLYYVAVTRARQAVELPGTQPSTSTARPAAKVTAGPRPVAASPNQQWRKPEDWRPPAKPEPVPAKAAAKPDERPARRGFFARLFGG